MVIDIKMCRFDNVPWGFRLVGGADFEVPLTVVKVTEGSIAEEAGLRVDDVIVRINDDATSPMSHDEAHKVISHCGNVFYLGIHREGAENENETFFPISEDLRPQNPRSPDSLIESSTLSQIGDLPCEKIPIDIEELERVLADESGSKAEDEEIATLLTPEPEVLQEQVAPGVLQKPALCQSSEVLRQLKEEAFKTKQEKDKEKKKWTTFMQKPDRPIPKSRQQLEAEARAANAYKVKIVKNYKKPEPVRPPSPVPEPEPEVEEPPKIATPPPEVEEEPPTDSEVPNLEQTGDPTETEDKLTPEKSAEEEALIEDGNESVREECVAKEDRIAESQDREDKPPSECGSLREKTEEEIQLEQQLADVQRQLLALANLPSTIQSTLDAVTKQLSELLPTFRLQASVVRETTPNIKEEEKQEEELEVTKSEIGDNLVADNEVMDKEETMTEITETEVTTAEHQETVKVETQIKEIIEEKTEVIEMSERNIEEEQMEEEQNLKRKKIDLWNHVFNDGNIGRKYFREYNSASVVKQLERVNFLKYQKPEKKIDLDKSEVYKIIHHLDRSPIRGIEVRPSVVVAEADVRRIVEP